MKPALALAALLLAAACSSSSDPSLPDGVKCSSTTTATSSATLAEGLRRAGSGSCIVLTSGVYQGNYEAADGVTVVGDSRESVTVEGQDATVPTLKLGVGAGLYRVTVKAPSQSLSVGVSASSGATLSDVAVSGAKSAGVLLSCKEGCTPNVLTGVQLTANAVGLWVSGAQAQVDGGRIAEQKALSLASGYGVVVSAGGSLTMTGTAVEKNEDLGVLVDGTGGTLVALKQATVSDNLGRGVWAQQMAAATAAAPLSLEGCTVERNRLVGVGLRGSSGLQIKGGRIAGTVSAPAVSDLDGQTYQVGDGLGLFEGTGAAQVDGVTFEGNARSQILVDKGASGIVLANETVTATGEQKGLVIQRTTAAVTSSATQTVLGAGQELAVSAPSYGVR